MLSIDLFDSKFEKPLHEGAVDRLEQHRIDTLNDRMQELLNRAKESHYKNNPEALAGLKREYQKIKDERDSYYKIRETQQPAQTPVKSVLDKDLVTPQQRVAGATPSKPGMAGAVKDVAGGLKRWLKGEPDQGPTYEQQDPPGQSPRAYGVGNFQRLVKANMGGYPTVTLEFSNNSADDLKLDQKGLDLISDYYDGLANDSQKNHFIYRVLPSRDETLKVLKQMGWNPQVQQELPGIPTQGELPLSEKKKSSDSEDIKAGDIKVARELQKLRAQYPAARSDVEAVARAEIDSSERSQRQLAAIRGANEKQDALLKQLVALDQEQGREINNLDQENNDLEKQLAQVQSTNDRLQQAIGQMTGTKKSSRPTPTAQKTSRTIDLIPGAPADNKPVAKEPAEPTTSPAIASMARQISGFSKPAPAIDKEVPPAADLDQDNLPDIEKPGSMKKLRPQKAANVDDFKLVAEHGGGIGPKQHWQDLMPEGWSDKYNPTPYAVYIDGRQWKEFRTDEEARRVADKVRANLKQQGRDQKVTIAPSQAYLKGKNVKEGQNNKLELAAKEFIQGVYDPAGPVYRAAYRSFQKGQQAEAILRKHIAQKYGVREKDLVDAMSNHMASRLAGRRYKQKNTMDEQFAMPGTTVPRKSVIQGYTVFFNPETRVVSVTRGGDSEEAAIEQARIGVVNLKNFRQAAERLIDKIDSDDQVINEGIKDTASATAVIACLLTGGSLTGCATAPQQTSAQQVLKTGQDIGRTVQTAQRITKAGVEAEVNQEIRNLLRGVSGRPEELNHSNILRIWRKIKGPAEPQISTPQNEAKEIQTRDDFVKERDRLLRMISQETNPANKQILRSTIRQLEGRAEAEGWISMQQRMVREDNASGAAEQAIIKRIMVAHTDLLRQYGPEKVMQAAEEVAYNVGDLGEIGTSDVSGWVNQVKQILGATA